MLAAGKLRMAAGSGSGSGSGSGTSTSYTLTVGTKTYGGLPTYDDGFYTTTSFQAEATNLAGIGSLSSSTFNGKTVKGIYWYSDSSHFDTAGQVVVEIGTSVSGSFISSLLVSGVSVGTMTYSSYVPASDSTLFYFSPLQANPFGTSGTKTVVLS